MIGIDAIVRRRVERVFDRLGRGEWSEIVGELSPAVHHVFPGDGPLGGERHSRDAVLLWLERLGRLYPGHEFAFSRVLSVGPPWDLWIAVQWTARLSPAMGDPYVNDGAHWIRVRWGRVTYFHAYGDTQRIEEACRTMAAAGIEEASAQPIR